MSEATKITAPRRLKGFRDIMPHAARVRLTLENIFWRQATLYGFQPVMTPALELAEVLLGSSGEETEKQTYSFEDHGGRRVALRFDLTVPFARFAAEHGHRLPMPFRRAQSGLVWRGENTQRGRYREFGQCDLDIIGSESVASDVEVLACFCSILGEVAARYEIGTGFRMALSHRGVLDRLLSRYLNLNDAPARSKALVWIDKLAKIGHDAVVKGLSGLGPSAHQCGQLLEVLQAPDLDSLCADADDRELMDAWSVLKTARMTVASIQTLSTPPVRVEIDLTTARGLAYYDGLVFETTLSERPDFGSICSGGRYNTLAERFSRDPMPGVGGSLGIDRLLAALVDTEAEDSDPVGGATKVLVIAMEESTWAYGASVAGELRASGYATEFVAGEKIKKWLRYANRIDVPCALILGIREAQDQTLTIKDMRAGTEASGVARQTLVAAVGSLLNSNPSGES